MCQCIYCVLGKSVFGMYWVVSMLVYMLGTCIWCAGVCMDWVFLICIGYVLVCLYIAYVWIWI